MTDQIQLEPEAHAFAEAAARSPLLFTLGPEQGRLALDQVQSGTIRKPAVDMQDLTITDGPSAQVALRILRPFRDPHPDSADLREMLGVAYYRAGRWNMAQKELEVYLALTGSTDGLKLFQSLARHVEHLVAA